MRTVVHSGTGNMCFFFAKARHPYLMCIIITIKLEVICCVFLVASCNLLFQSVIGSPVYPSEYFECPEHFIVCVYDTDWLRRWWWWLLLPAEEEKEMQLVDWAEKYKIDFAHCSRFFIILRGESAFGEEAVCCGGSFAFSFHVHLIYSQVKLMSRVSLICFIITIIATISKTLASLLITTT